MYHWSTVLSTENTHRVGTRSRTTLTHTRGTSSLVGRRDQTAAPRADPCHPAPPPDPRPAPRTPATSHATHKEGISRSRYRRYSSDNRRHHRYAAYDLTPRTENLTNGASPREQLVDTLYSAPTCVT
ncbi:unnamed protein product [Spodoptera exigua]|nr:unnamed protein product [Spodoptera exigua]